MIPKFRVWNKKTESFINYGDLMLDLKNAKVYAGDVGIPEYTIDVTKQVILMQYTGLKDKNGVEIYEGDIVRRRDFVCDEVYFNVGQISYSGVGVFAGQFIFKSQSGNIDGMYSRYGDEVIGNIYENPELMEVAE